MNSEGPIVHLHSDCFAELRHICLVGANCSKERSTKTGYDKFGMTTSCFDDTKRGRPTTSLCTAAGDRGGAGLLFRNSENEDISTFSSIFGEISRKFNQNRCKFR